jgi:hypothetical protein
MCIKIDHTVVNCFLLIVFKAIPLIKDKNMYQKVFVKG